MKKTALFAIAVTITLSSFFTALVITSDDTQAARRRVPPYQYDEQAVSDFKRAVSLYVISASLSKDESAPSASNVVNVNSSIQERSFSSRINDEYNVATDDIKENAQAVSDSAEEVQNSTLVERDAAISELKEDVATLDSSKAEMDSAIEIYKQKLAKSNTTTKYVILAVVGAIILFFVFAFLNYRRKIEASRKSLFAGDPQASNLPREDQKVLAEVYDGMLEYERLMPKNDSVSLKGHINTYYSPYREKAAKESLGAYRSIIFEYAGLIAISEGRTGDAQQCINHAKHFSGGKLYTKTAQEFPLA